MKKKIRLIKCSKCKINKAIIFPLKTKRQKTRTKVLGRKHFCGRCWKSVDKYYDKWIKSTSGVIVGQLMHLVSRLEDDESLEVLMHDSFLDYQSTSGTSQGMNYEASPPVSTADMTGVNYQKKIHKLRRLWRAIKNLFK